MHEHRARKFKSTSTILCIHEEITDHMQTLTKVHRINHVCKHWPMESFVLTSQTIRSLVRARTVGSQGAIES